MQTTIAPPATGHLISISDYYGDEGAGTGGAGVSALRIADLMRSAGVDLEIIAAFAYPRSRRGEAQVEFLDGPDLREAAKTSSLALATGLWNERERRRVQEITARRDPAETVVMLHQWTRSLSPAVLSALTRFPHIVYVHDYFWACPTGTYFNYRTNQACDLRPMGTQCMTTVCDRVGAPQKAYRVLRQLVKQAAVAGSAQRRAFVHISDGSRRFMEPLFPESVHATIYHPIGDTPAPVPTPLAFDVGYFGRIETEKGVFELAAAAERTGKRALLVGTGPRSAELRERFPSLTIMDWATRSEVFGLMQSCRAVALPSLWKETWGLIIPEALSQSVPVLVSARAGSSELVTRFGGGIVFDPLSPAAFDDAILRVTAQRETFAEAAGRAFDMAGLDRAAYLAKILGLIYDTFGISLTGANR